MAELIQYANGVPGIKWPLDKAIVRIGRADHNNDVSLDDAFVSKRHAQVEMVVSADHSTIEYYLRDMRSTNHTYLNQAPVEYVKLNHNDTVVIGKSKFVFLCEGVREYVTLTNLLEHSVDLIAKESDESLTLAIEEITEEIGRPRADTMDGRPVFTHESGRHKFSRRLNLH